jgi:mannose-6-phosphate isomerase-like protein (cupin superfamily)
MTGVVRERDRRAARASLVLLAALLSASWCEYVYVLQPPLCGLVMERQMQPRTRRSFLGVSVLTTLAACARSLGVSLTRSDSITELRRVVTGNRAGRAIIIQNGVSPRVVTTETLPGLALVEVWATDEIPTLPVAPVDLTTTMKSFVPGPGGTRFRIVQFPGASTRAFDQEAFRREYLVKAPGLAEAMERQDSGMHTTDSVDYGVVISGEITLELDDGVTVSLKQGDCVVQNGTRHAWRNRNTTPCVMAFVLLGAAREGRS